MHRCSSCLPPCLWRETSRRLAEGRLIVVGWRARMASALRPAGRGR
ncbi:hypothetical protein HMPREF0004_3126 [Achromobacter piechaudii ATCC 43553]|uniref:Uncharacterized protein n=1 Tax=Achromobacter piechaudii ATCC 43553 TaxID=742159 RepID=D4XCC9_9BURK|nr:hypothetical protein HMPREF0004_3126 [Achromobacter piechaudii ATCC 43553]